MNDTTLPPSKVPRPKTGRFGLSEWNRLLQVSKDLAQRKGEPLRKISMSEVQQHKYPHDGWIVLRGKVYNLSPYLVYHPGGDSILRPILGKDCTRLYDKYHRWVNEENLIGKLLLGYLDTSASSSNQPKTTSNDGFVLPAPRPPKQVDMKMLEPKSSAEEENDDIVGSWEVPEGNLE